MKSFATFLALAFITGRCAAPENARRKNSPRAEQLSRMPAPPLRLSQPMFRLDPMCSSLFCREQ
jgi:hypothetical protein